MAPSASAGTSRREPLNLRVRPEDRGLIDRAAKRLGKTRTDFILDAARTAAREALIDQSILLVDPEACAAFLKQLDAPPQPNTRLRKTMRGPAPWEA